MTFRNTFKSTMTALLVGGACASAFAGLAAEPKAPAGGAGAETPGGKARTVEAVFAVLDEDGSGTVDRAEWQTRKMTIFYLRDIDNDFRLSRSEMPGLARNPFDAADADKDGYLSGYEFNQAAFSRFEGADTGGGGDGKVSGSEFRSYMENAGTPR